MADTRTIERVIFDPRSEQVANAPLEVTGAFLGSPPHGIFLGKHRYPSPEKVQGYVGARGSEGERPAGTPVIKNRDLEYELLVSESAQLIGPRVNLVPNPSPAIDLVGVQQQGTGVVIITRGGPAADCPIGEYYFHVVTDGSTALQGIQLTADMAVVAAATYTGWAWVRAPLGQSMRMVATETVGGAGTTLTTFTGTETWQFITVTRTMAAGVTGADLVIRTQGSVPNTFDVCGMGFEQMSASPGGSWDGDTPGAVWNGVPFASTQTLQGTGSNRKRFELAMFQLEEKVTKFEQEGGTILRVLPSGKREVFDVESGEYPGQWDRPFNRGQQVVEFTVPAAPYARLAEGLVAAAANPISAPVYVARYDGVKGNQEAIARALLTDTAAQRRDFTVWGRRTKRYDPAATAALYYEAESRTPLGGSSLTAGAGSGGGSNLVTTGNLPTSPCAVLGTQAAGGGAHLTHVGVYEVWLHLYNSTALVNPDSLQLLLEYAQGDLRLRRHNALWTPPTPEAGYYWACLGTVKIDDPRKLPVRWEAQVLASCQESGHSLLLDFLALIPSEESYGRFKASQEVSTSSALSLQDGMDHAVGTALAGKTAPAGGVHAGTGPSDFTVVQQDAYPTGGKNRGGEVITASFVRRSAMSDADQWTGRYDWLPTSLAELVAEVDVRFSSVPPAGTSAAQGLIVRGNPAGGAALTARHARLVFKPNEGRVYFEIRNAGVKQSSASYLGGNSVKAINYWYRIRLRIDARGNWSAWLTTAGTEAWAMIMAGQSPLLETGQPLASGYCGIVDSYVGASGTSDNRDFDNLLVAPLLQDAALFPSRAAEVRHDGAFRQDLSGAIWTPASYDGDYMRVPPYRRDRRPTEMIFLPMRNDPELSSQPAGHYADTQTLALYATPRVLAVAEPN